MQVHLTMLRLRRELTYHNAPTPPPLLKATRDDASLYDAALEQFAQQSGECLLSLCEEGLITMDEDGPRIKGTPRVTAIYLASDARVGSDAFKLEASAYVFFQWQMNATLSSASPDQDTTRPNWVDVLEEVAREIWWQEIDARGPWFLRLVPEDDRVAFQILRRIRD